MSVYANSFGLMIIVCLLLALFLPSEVQAKQARAAVIGDADRRTEEQYAARNGLTLNQVRDDFGATGRIDCPHSSATANVTYKSNVIATAAHLFQDGKSCANKEDPKSCYFVVGHEPAEQRIQIEGLVASRLQCEKPFESQEDWAVLKLHHPASGIRPYSLPSNRWMPLLPSSRVVAVLSQSDDFMLQGRLTRSVANCTIESVLSGPEGVVGWYRTNCDTGFGGSGGAILRRGDGGFELAGIVKGTLDSSSIIVAVTGKFYDAIYDAGWDVGFRRD